MGFFFRYVGPSLCGECTDDKEAFYAKYKTADLCYSASYAISFEIWFAISFT